VPPNANVAYGATTVPAEIRSRFIDGINGLRMHVLEAGSTDQTNAPERPCILLLHGFPELAYSWRKVMPRLAALGFHVVAPDLRGYGLTSGADARYDGDWQSFRMLSLVRDVIALARSLQRSTVHAVIGHDFGSPLAAWCAVSRPDIFERVALMSAPFAGTVPLVNKGPLLYTASAQPQAADVHVELAALAQARKHYQWYYSSEHANADMAHCPQGLADFLRAYYHVKSADWVANKPYKLDAWDARSLAKLPRYYVMDHGSNMAETVAPEMPSDDVIAACKWLPNEELQVYSDQYSKTGFQGGLQWYRCATSTKVAAELSLFAGKAIEVPACFLGGKSDWGVYQVPGAFEAMQSRACKQLFGAFLIDGAGHWVQQEQPDAVVTKLGEFLSQT
jgi:pimeloyl-ACP methyl ester carboxylesterase